MPDTPYVMLAEPLSRAEKKLRAPYTNRISVSPDEYY
jgi:hypothetical protein